MLSTIMGSTEEAIVWKKVAIYPVPNLPRLRGNILHAAAFWFTDHQIESFKMNRNCIRSHSLQGKSEQAIGDKRKIDA